MKSKPCTQYICDFCGKKKYSASAMSKHEKHCTMNPNRECRMCLLISGVQNNLDDLKKMVVDPIVIKTHHSVFDNEWDAEEVQNENDVIESFEKMKENSHCPVCILSVIRQKKLVFIPQRDFDYQREFDIAMEKINQEKDYVGSFGFYE